MPDQTEQLRAEVARLRDALDATVGHITNLEPSRDEALAMAEAALATPAPPDPKDARIAQLEEALRPFVAAWSARTIGDDGNMRVDIPFAYLRAAHTAILTPPGKRQEEQRRQAQIEVLEAQPCWRAGTHAPECKDIDEEMFGLCPRCRALAALKSKGEKGC